MINYNNEEQTKDDSLVDNMIQMFGADLVNIIDG